jgi:hypothetical protein
MNPNRNTDKEMGTDKNVAMVTNNAADNVSDEFKSQVDALISGASPAEIDYIITKLQEKLQQQQGVQQQGTKQGAQQKGPTEFDMNEELP